MNHLPFVSLGNESLDDIIHFMGEAICVTDKNMVFLGANQNYADFHKKTPQELLGKSVFEILPEFKKSFFYEACEHCFNTGETISQFGYSLTTQNWMVIRVHKIKDNRYAMTAHKLSNGSKDFDYGSQFDSLTSFPNRLMFERDFENLKNHGQHNFNLTLIDISHFKNFNETLGFKMGDKCLIEVSSVIKKAACMTDRVYRFGNDQFLVVGNNSQNDSLKRQENLTLALAKPLILENQEFLLQFHIGTHTSDNLETGVSSLNKVERALSWGKKHKLNYAHYNDSMIPTNFDPGMTKAIQDGLKKNEFVLFFQPEMDMLDQKTCGAEVLIRWIHPEKGMIPPLDFLPFAEETNLIRNIDQYVVKKTFKFLKDKKHIPNLFISINLSSQSICNEETLTLFKEQFQLTGVSPKSICVEIVESSLMHDIETSEKVIEGLKKMGIKIAIDDFGTGYSSISYLVRYPAHYLKIDRSFVQTLTTSEMSKTMIKNIIGLAHGMGMGVVAEGIETEIEMKTLKDMHCDIGQGYFFSKPLKQEDFEKWIDKNGFSNMSSDIF